MPGFAEWSPNDAAFRTSETTAVVGYGDEAWNRASDAVLRWEVKTRSGFSVESAGPVRSGQRLTVTARFCGFAIKEPVEVVEVARERTRCGFSYRTLPGHPVNGEEAFVVYRDGDEVRLTVRSLTRAAPQQPWRFLFPVLLVAQRIVRRRYLRALLLN